MSRHLLTLNSDMDRARAKSYVSQAPAGTRVEFKASKRTLPQNDRMWAMLTDISKQKEHHGRKYRPDVWKAIFIYALWKDGGIESGLVPSLDGKELVHVQSSSDLSKDEMSEMLEFITSWGVQNGVTFHDGE